MQRTHTASTCHHFRELCFTAVWVVHSGDKKDGEGPDAAQAEEAAAAAKSTTTTGKDSGRRGQKQKGEGKRGAAATSSFVRTECPNCGKVVPCSRFSLHLEMCLFYFSFW